MSAFCHESSFSFLSWACSSLVQASTEGLALSCWVSWLSSTPKVGAQLLSSFAIEFAKSPILPYVTSSDVLSKVWCVFRKQARESSSDIRSCLGRKVTVQRQKQASQARLESKLLASGSYKQPSQAALVESPTHCRRACS